MAVLSASLGAVTAYIINLHWERKLVPHQGSRREQRIAARDKQANTNTALMRRYRGAPSRNAHTSIIRHETLEPMKADKVKC